MTQPLFDPGGFFQFNLASGEVRTAQRRALVVTEQLLVPLVASAVEKGDLKAVRQFGRELGEEIKSSLGSDPGSMSPEIVVSHISNVLSLMGFGKLTLQQWGDALVAIVDSLPSLDDKHLAAAALLGGLFSVVSQREVACVPVGSKAQFVVVDPSIAETVWGWSVAGESLGQVAQRLQQETI